MEGYYIYHIKRTICPLGDSVKPEDEQHVIMQDSFSDWNMPRNTVVYEINPDTLCQYTGGRDKYHTKIWENDICKVNTQNIDEEDGYFVVQWDAETLRFVLTGNGLVFDFDNLRMEQVEVIGNVFDNPELLEVM